MKKLFLASVLGLMLIMVGCASVPKCFVNVDSLRSSDAVDKKSFILIPGNKDTTVNDLQFKEYAAYISRALVLRGFVPAESIEVAHLAIFVVYGIGNPKQHQYSYSLY